MSSFATGSSDAVEDPAACPGDSPRPVLYTLDPQFNEVERTLVEQAMQVWSEGTGGRVRYVPGGRDLVIEKLDRAEQLQPWDTEWPRHVALTKGTRIWVVGSTIDEPGEYRALMVHELGHHLGVGHIEDTPVTFMHSTINDTPSELRKHPRLPDRDARAFCQVHRCTCAY
jgi:hypothetical protein